jgi:hypothetical protein
MYNNEDYFLQIDPHSRFNKNWDITLIDTFNQAVETVNNKKTVLTGYLGKYLYNKDDGQIYVDDNLSYTRWIPNEFVIGDVIPKFNHAPLHSISDELNISSYNSTQYYSFELNDIYGRIVCQNRMNKGKVALSLENLNLSPGIYFLTINSGNKKYNYKRE